MVNETENPIVELFGIIIATMGMLSLAAYVLAMVMFNPIADTTHGIVKVIQVTFEIILILLKISNKC